MEKNRYFKCKGITEDLRTDWAHKVMLDKIYEGMLDYPMVEEGVLIIRIGEDKALFVDADQFEEVMKRPMDMTRKPKIIFSTNKCVVEEININHKAEIEERLSKPFIKTKEINELLDELIKLK